MSETVEGINQAYVTCGDLPRLREDPMCIHPFLGEQGVQVDCRPFGWEAQHQCLFLRR